jgi:hypothetical protein
MYLSYTNDGPNNKDEERLLLAVVLDGEFFDNVRKIIETCKVVKFPYSTTYEFVFPTDKVRLLESYGLDEAITDCKKYESWEMGGDDPLDYYRFQVHQYEPKEEFWKYCTKPDSVVLHFCNPNCFGFDAHYKGETYYGYAFDWSNYL